MIFQMKENYVSIERDGRIIYDAILDDFLRDIGGEFCFALPFGVAGLRYDAGARVTKFFTASGFEMPFPNDGENLPIERVLTEHLDAIRSRQRMRRMLTEPGKPL